MIIIIIIGDTVTMSHLTKYNYINLKEIPCLNYCFILSGVHEPGLDHEENRRKVEMDVNEMWYYLRKQLSELKNDLSSDFKDQAKERIENMESDVHGYYM